MNHIHRQGIIHRDIKLENIFLSKDKSVAVIGDFGLSNFFTPASQLKTRCGSAEYAAPELLDKTKNYDKSIDIWSSGVVLFAMLTGQLPFNAEDNKNKVSVLFDQIRLGLTERHLNLLNSLSVELNSLLCQVLCVDVTKRLTVAQIMSHSWFNDVQCPAEDQVSDLNLEQQMEVAKLVQQKLKLSQWSPEQVLAYVMSARGKYGKTAGCYNLLARDLVANTNKLVPVIKPATFGATVSVTKPSSVKASTVPNSITVKTAKVPATSGAEPSSGKMDVSQPETDKRSENERSGQSFWQTGQGQAAVFALSQLKQAQSSKKESPKPVDNKKLSSARQELVVKPFFKPDKLNHWRRSIKPAPGNKRLGRLKRVDTGTSNSNLYC